MTQITKPSLVRTFYPVGQGAFYVEKHKIGEQTFTMVYDCGTATSEHKSEFRKRRTQQQILKENINKAFPEGDRIIDLLVISHFHADHINGIEYLKNHFEIKRVVIPYINDKSKALVKINNYLNSKNIHENLIDNPSIFFGSNTIIIEIKERDLDNLVDIPVVEIDLLTINQSESRESGTVFKIGNPSYHWYFIPFNYKHKESLVQFEKALKEKDLTIDKFLSSIEILEHKKDLREAYKKIKWESPSATIKEEVPFYKLQGDLNMNSLVLYSGSNSIELYHEFLNNKDGHDKPSQMMKILSDVTKEFTGQIIPDGPYPAGCLYLGDIDLKADNLIRDLHRKLSKHLNFIGIFQIPHHGSMHNFDSKIFSLLLNLKLTLLSYGVRNRYKHPTLDIEKLTNAVPKLIIWHITEKNETILAQFSNPNFGIITRNAILEKVLAK